MYAPVFGFFDAGNSIVSPRQAYFEQHRATSAQKAIKLCDARAIRHWFNNPRPSRAPQSHVGLVG